MPMAVTPLPASLAASAVVRPGRATFVQTDTNQGAIAGVHSPIPGIPTAFNAHGVRSPILQGEDGQGEESPPLPCGRYLPFSGWRALQ
jgi:hypothetical protein